MNFNKTGFKISYIKRYKILLMENILKIWNISKLFK